MLIQRLYELNRSSNQFSEQLDQLLHDKEWIPTLKLAPDDELVNLVDYLDNVRSAPTSAESYLSPVDSRLSRSDKTTVQEVPPHIAEDLRLKNDSPVNLRSFWPTFT